MDERQQKLNQFNNLMAAFADPIDDVIYHYTTDEGLRGIIENSELWLTNTAFVNDTTECKALQQEKDVFTESDLNNSKVKDSWKNYLNHSDNDHASYIASFSKAKASLDQYRAYGSFCLGFDARKLKIPHSNFYQCVYKKEEIKKWIQEKEAVKEWQRDKLDDQYLRGAAFNLIYAASRKYKSKHFSNEQEVRLISVSNHTWEPYLNSSSMFAKQPPIYYRDNPIYKIPVPYVKFFIKDSGAKDQDIVWGETYRESKERKLRYEKNVKRSLLPITEILIGPMQHQEEALIACKILLSDMGYKDVHVYTLDIPYRGF